MSSLVSIPLPAMWCIMNHQLWDQDPEVDANGNLVDGGAFCQDLVWIAQVRRKEERWVVDLNLPQIDVGWYPDGDPNGQYGIEVVQVGNDSPLFEYEFRNRHLIARVIEHIAYEFSLIKPDLIRLEDRIRDIERDFSDNPLG
jgi:hypothetical protein